MTNTCLMKPEMTSAATDYFSQREAEVHAACRRRSAAFFSEAAAVYGDPFWTARAERSDDDVDVVGNSAVRAAFDALRAGTNVTLRPSDDVRIQPAATIEGREVVMRDAVLLPGVAEPMRFAAGVDLPALVQLARESVEMSALIHAYRTTIAPAPLDGLIAGVSLLVAHRALIHDSHARDLPLART